MRYYLGLDNGGTNTKAALFTPDGTQIAVESVATAALTPAPGFVERDMEEMWRDNCAVIRSVLEKSGVRAEEIAGVGLCGHGKGLYLWGKDGKSARRGILSADNRAWRYPVEWRENGTEERAFALSCQHVMACQPVSLLAWLRDNEPETMENIRWVFECKDYVRFRLTGAARAEITDYSGSGLMDLHTKSFSKELLSLFGIESVWDALPPLCASLDIAGYITEEAAALTGPLAVNVTDETNICMIAGTWSINEYPRRTPVTDGTVLMNSLFCLPGYYLIEESSPTSAGNNQWFIDRLLPELKAEAKAAGKSVYDILNDWVDSFAPGDFVPVFLPFLTASNVDPRARAAFVGLNASHSRREMARAVYEGIAFSHRYHLDRLMRSRPDRSGTIRLAGGAARSKVWTQMFADVMNMPVETVSADETGALGCCVAVAAALGDYKDAADAAAHMCRSAGRVLPRADAARVYEEKYALYLKTIECLNALWPDMQRFMEEHHA